MYARDDAHEGAHARDDAHVGVYARDDAHEGAHARDDARDDAAAEEAVDEDEEDVATVEAVVVAKTRAAAAAAAHAAKAEAATAARARAAAKAAAAAEAAAEVEAFEAEVEAEAASLGFRRLPRANLAAFLDDDEEEDDEDEDEDEDEATAAEAEATEVAPDWTRSAQAAGAVDERIDGDDDEDDDEAADVAADEATDEATDLMTDLIWPEEEGGTALGTARVGSVPPTAATATARLLRLFPCATEAVVAAVVECSGVPPHVDFSEAARTLFYQLLLAPPARLGARRPAGGVSAAGAGTKASGTGAGKAGFQPPCTKVDELLGGAAPSASLLQGYSQAQAALHSALDAQGGPPQPCWAWRYIRVQQARQEVFDIVRDVIRGGRQRPGADGLRWLELPSSVPQVKLSASECI